LTTTAATADGVVLRDEIVRLIQDLVRIPSQGFHDPLDPILDALAGWHDTHGLSWRFLDDRSGRRVALLASVDSGRPGPTLCLDACLDTAPVGWPEAWRDDPFSARIVDGKIYGRGVADSKAAVTIFSHLAREFARSQRLARGVLHFLFDGDEHTGGFGGVKAFVEGPLKGSPAPALVAVGYPGNDKIVIGARGFFRVRVHTFGDEVHSGSSSRDTSQNAVLKMARLLDLLSREPVPAEPDPDFSFGPTLSPTAIRGGSGFSQIPGYCQANVDVRLTPGFGAEAARRLIAGAVARIDETFPTGRPSSFDELESWPWYKLDRETEAVRILRQCAERELGRTVRLAVGGPSNIGNYLAARGIPAICGFGVTYENLHGANECVDIDSILPVYRTYRAAIERWSAEVAADALIAPDRLDLLSA
jgi:succinyl-diaminopimelate desuccinylase